MPTRLNNGIIINLNIPKNTHVVGSLDNLDEDQDLFQAILPNGYGVDVGWYDKILNQFNPDETSGIYKLVYFKNHNYHHQIAKLETKDISIVRNLVEYLLKISKEKE